MIEHPIHLQKGLSLTIIVHKLDYPKRGSEHINMIGTPSKPPPSRENPAVKNLRVFKINPVTDPRWQAFVAEHPEGSIYHHPAWISVVENEYGQVAEHLACEDGDGQLVAILPMLHTRGLPFKLGGQQAATRLASLPRTPLAGPLSMD